MGFPSPCDEATASRKSVIPAQAGMTSNKAQRWVGSRYGVFGLAWPLQDLLTIIQLPSILENAR